MTQIINQYKLRIFAVELNFQQKTVFCKCTTTATSAFSTFNVQHDVILSEETDLGNNPAWTNDDILQAVATKTGISPSEIIITQ